MAKHELPQDCTAVLLESVIDSGTHGTVYKGTVVSSSGNVSSSNQGSCGVGASAPGKASGRYCCASAAAAAAQPQLEVAVKVAPELTSSFERELTAMKAVVGNRHFTQLFAVGGVARDASLATVAAVAAQAAACRHAVQTGRNGEMNDEHTMPCLIMELCAGTLESSAIYTEQEILEDMQRVVQGLNMVHNGVGRRGLAFIHRWAQAVQLTCSMCRQCAWS
jgi:serine/threonine protein kinase